MQHESAAPTIGLARLPHELRRLLDDAASNAEAAALLLHRVVGARDGTAIEALDGVALQANQITTDFVRRLRHGRVSSGDRARLLALARAVDDAVEALAVAGRAVIGCDCGDDGRDLAAVVRDAVRAEARSVRLLAAQTGAEGDAWATDLARERRRIQRRAFLAEAEGADGVLAVIRRRTCVEELGSACDAALRAIETIDRTRAAGV